MNKTCLLYLFFLFSFLACKNQDEILDLNQGTNIDLDISADYLKLIGDSANFAGKLSIAANSPEVYLKWNVTNHSNLDTTQTCLKLLGGKADLPIKWNKSEGEDSCAPKHIAFDAGVLITSGNTSKYVHLIWGGEIDSAKILSSSRTFTRAGERALPAAAEIYLAPPVLTVNSVSGGVMLVESSAPIQISVGYSSVITEYFDMSELLLPNIFTESGILDFKWKKAAPQKGFITPVTFDGIGAIRVTGYVQKVDDTPYVWSYRNCIPEEGSVIPNAGGDVVVSADTNAEWCISCPDAIPDSIFGLATDFGTKHLSLNITPNTEPVEKEITVSVIYQGTVQKLLKFKQSPVTTLNFRSSDLPEKPNNIPAIGNVYNFTFSGTYIGNLQMGMIIDGSDLIEGPKITTVSGNNIVQMTVPENQTTEMRNIIFKYRADGGWIDIVEANRTQEAGSGIVGTVAPGEVLPGNSPMPDCDMTYNCTFIGDFTGNIEFRARRGSEIFVGTTGPVEKKLEVFIPRLSTSRSQNVIFEYSIDGGINWKEIESRIQNGESFSISPISPYDKEISADGSSFSSKLGGTFSNTVIIKAATGSVELARGSAKAPDTVNLKVPQNNGIRRSVTFYYSKNYGQTWYVMEIKYQKGKI